MEKRHKQGDIREDGMVFWQYKPAAKNGEYWVTKEKYEQFNQTKKQYRKNNRDKINSGIYLWKKRNPEKAKAIRNKHVSKKRKTDPLYCITLRFRELTNKAFRRNGYTKESISEKYLGCSWKFLKNYIEQRFQEGMTWENRNLWHIDHIIPTSIAKTKSELIKLFHYTNLRPLWAEENRKKLNKTNTQYALI